MPPETCFTISDSLSGPIQTSAAEEGLLVNVWRIAQHRDPRWQSIIDEKLIEWSAFPGQFESEEFQVPAAVAIGLASDIAHSCWKQGVAAPTRVVPNGEGGVVFERIDGTTFEAIEIEADGQVEYRVFEKSRLVGQSRLH